MKYGAFKALRRFLDPGLGGGSYRVCYFFSIGDFCYHLPAISLLIECTVSDGQPPSFSFHGVLPFLTSCNFAGNYQLYLRLKAGPPTSCVTSSTPLNLPVSFAWNSHITFLGQFLNHVDSSLAPLMLISDPPWPLDLVVFHLFN